MIGTTVSHYRILEKLGAGGMGEVYLAQDTKLDRKVALKFLPSSTASDPHARERLLREARAASKLHHPNIVTIHSIEEARGQHFIVMEYVKGVPLTRYVKDQRLSPEHIRHLLIDLCNGLDHAHRAGVVHRDLKPDNIIVESDGRIRILDFGVAMLAGTPRLTQTGSMIGTTAYVSPEQVRGEDADARSDLFSLGVLMYELLAGVHPFSGAHEAATLYAIAHEHPPAVTKAAPDADRVLAAVIEKCLNKDRAQRFASASQVAQSLSGDADPVATDIPETRYTKSGHINVAYQVYGDGDVDLVFVPGYVSHIELIWQDPYQRVILDRLGKKCRVILFDKRGTGLSDRVAELPPLEQRMDDVRAVMDAAGSKRAVLFGFSEGGPMCMLFAATYPDRTIGLISYGSYALRIRDEDYPWAPTREERAELIAHVEKHWGTAVDLADLAPSLAGDAAYAKWLATYWRQSASPGAAAALLAMNSKVDIRSILPSIRVPSLILHRTGDRDVQVEGGRYIAERIPGARFVELEGNDHLPWAGDLDSVLQAMEGFIDDLDTPGQPETALLTAMHIRCSDAESREFREALDTSFVDHPPRSVHVDPQGATVLFDGSIRSLRAAEHLAGELHRTGRAWSIGLHSGECTLSKSITTGIAVDVACAITRAAPVPGVRLTSTVQELVAEAGLSFKEYGTVSVPGVDYTWRIVERPLVHASLPSESRPSIAVLPFANMSTDPENEFFADGLAEELINALSKIEGLRVAARTSAFSFKGKDAHVRDIGRQLDVGTILEGSVRRSGNKVRVTAQLVKCDDGYHLWSDRFDRNLDDVFQIQDEITGAIVEHLKVRLMGPTSKATVRRPTVNVDALTLYMKGRYFWSKRTESNLDRGVKYFEEALKIDPDYPMAHVGLADAQNLYGFYNLRPPGEAFPRAREAAMRALAIDPSLAAAHTSLAYVQFYHDWNWQEAEKTFLHAQALDPSYAFAYSFHGNLLQALGRHDEAMACWTHSLKLDPLATIQNLGAGWAHYHAGRFQEAIESMRGALEMDPAFMVGHLFIGRAYEHAGHLDLAVSSFEKTVQLSERMPNTLAELGRACAKSGDRDRAIALMKELEAAVAKRYVCPSDLALFHMSLGNADLAFTLMDRAADTRSPDLVMLNVDARFDPFRGDDRFESVVRKVGLPS